MADRQRCHCGELPVTIDGYCSKHKHMSNPAPRVRSAEEKLAECQQARHYLNEDLLKAKNDVSELRQRINHLEKVLTLVAIGDIKPEDINAWR